MPTTYPKRSETPRGAWVNVTLTPSLKRKFRLLCAEEGVSMSTKAMQLIQAEVEAAEEAKR